MARNPTRRTADIVLIKNAVYLNENSKNNSQNTSSNKEECSEYNNFSKRQLTQLMNRPMTPLSPSNTIPQTNINTPNEIIFSPIVTNESLSNISNLLSIDGRNKSNIINNKITKKAKTKKRNTKSSTNDTFNQIYKYSGECLSPSPSPTTSPSSKMSNLTSLSLSNVLSSNKFIKSSSINDTINSNSMNDNFRNSLLCKYLKGNSYSSKNSNQVLNEMNPNSKLKLTQNHSLQANTIEAINALNNNKTVKNDLLTLNKRPKSNTKSNTKLDNLERLKEYARMKQKKFILSRLIYFKSNKLLR